MQPLTLRRGGHLLLAANLLLLQANAEHGKPVAHARIYVGASEAA
jgi:hypothetical protein